LLQGSAFEPELIALLAQAYETASVRIGKDQPPLVLETIAKQIIDIAGRGERDPQKMVEYAIRSIEPLPPAG
jgi:hypothetical protein